MGHRWSKPFKIDAFGIVFHVSEDGTGRMEGTTGVDEIDAFLLAMACENIDLNTPAMLCALETALDGIANNAED